MVHVVDCNAVRSMLSSLEFKGAWTLGTLQVGTCPKTCPVREFNEFNVLERFCDMLLYYSYILKGNRKREYNTKE